MSSGARPLSVTFLPSGHDIQARQVEVSDLEPLLMLAFGPSSRAKRDDCPLIEPGLTDLDGNSFLEVWGTPSRVTYARVDGFMLAATQDVLCGSIEVDTQDTPLETLSFDLYRRLFNLIERQGFPQLWRIFNYFPNITSCHDGFERYQRFTLGRHNAFIAQARPVSAAPAACALGSQSGPFALAFIAGRKLGLPVENPRQVSAYAYPERYGPCSPTFSRGLVVDLPGSIHFFLSGTASIVGHETRHPGNLAAQAQETMTNIMTMREEAHRMGLAADCPMLFKVYLREAGMRDAVQTAIAPQLKEGDIFRFLQADICRPDLMLEIDGASLG